MPDWCVMVDSTGMLTFYDFYFQMRSMKSEKPSRNISQCFVPDKKKLCSIYHILYRDFQQFMKEDCRKFPGPV